jgi:uncharacterized membrane protein
MKNLLLWLMTTLYIVAGLNHFVHPEFYLKIMPAFMPYPLAMVYVSGLCEVLFALLLIPLSTRRLAAWLIILLLIAIFPANLNMTYDYWQRHDRHLWITIVRLPLQLVLIWWAWQYTRKRSA